MTESELAKQIKRGVDAGDKLVRDITEDTQEILTALRDIKNLFQGRRGEDEEGPETK